MKNRHMREQNKRKRGIKVKKVKSGREKEQDEISWEVLEKEKR